MDDLTSRYAVCRVGDGFSVEDRRTGDRVSWHATAGAAKNAQRRASAAAVADHILRSGRCSCGNPKPVGWSACTVHGGMPVGPQPVLNINSADPECPYGVEADTETEEGL